jgi:hypothetical protein
VTRSGIFSHSIFDNHFVRLLPALVTSIIASMSPLRRFWPVLAVIAGGLLVYFEYRQYRGVTADNIFWLCVGALIVVLGLIDLFQKPPAPRDDN